ncbi:MAG: Rrf2 family transcriptional regulator [Akkermansiaceae bacterium]|jgi:Rrf2 family transcriptional regulator, cysteine metabolism repressor|nr:Rrf2 family transcriptional regulator [Akkermansiaceae bacterium]MDP4648154.1 Rrf2 family transcriptional regulator [Akkermansiaceae bacterium]MDP4778918.1 Rrf2 family transcriptional regulator [Akkermansiaceae bacterium]MDP4898828.1 Rrf2 family transcriptional regulator [Akkermansiaceae bacterium]
MKISQKLEYACRALAQLAKTYDGKTLTRLDDLAQREVVSSNFLVQILNDVRRAGLIDSRRGANGGYMLSRPPANITLRQIVDAVEPSQLQNTAQSGQGESGTAIHRAWETVSGKLAADLDAITLESVASPPSDPMFYI